MKALNDAVASFEQANPDIKVQLTYVPFGQLLSRTLRTAAVHRPPAISARDNPDVLRAAEAGIYEAAKFDGASAWQRLIRITIPMLTPVSPLFSR